jgi:hypothetical protein
MNLSSTISQTLSVLGENHFNRPAGSFLTIEAGARIGGANAALLLGSLDYQDVTEEAKALGVAFGTCRYYRAEIPSALQGFEACSLLSELTDDQLARVRCVRGHHGTVEHQIAGEAPVPTAVLHVIVGEHEGNTVVYTWYPGRLTPPNETVKFV